MDSFINRKEMILSFLLVGSGLNELTKNTIYGYFKQFGTLTDHIVKVRPAIEQKGIGSSNLPECEQSALTISFRNGIIDEKKLVDRVHFVAGIKITCSKLEVPNNISKNKIFIKYLDKKATVHDVQLALEKYGKISDIQLTKKLNRPLNLGLCNVTFEDPGSIIKILSGPTVEIKGKKVKIDIYQSHDVSSVRQAINGGGMEGKSTDLVDTSNLGHQSTEELLRLDQFQPVFQNGKVGIHQKEFKDITKIEKLKTPKSLMDLENGFNPFAYLNGNRQKEFCFSKKTNLEGSSTHYRKIIAHKTGSNLSRNLKTGDLDICLNFKDRLLLREALDHSDSNLRFNADIISAGVLKSNDISDSFKK